MPLPLSLRPVWLVGAAVFALFVALAVLHPLHAHAATITVTATADTTATDGNVTLREAVNSIDGGADSNADVTVNRTGAYGTNDTITFNIPGPGPNTITLGSNLDVTTTMTVAGSGAANTIIAAGASITSFNITGGSFTVSGLTFSAGETAIQWSSNATLSVSDTIFSALGFGIYAPGSGTISVTRSLFTDIISKGLASYGSSTITITNSTFSRIFNAVTTDSATGGSVSVANVTLSGNTNVALVQGNGVPLTARNSIITGSAAEDCDGTITDSGGNLSYGTGSPDTTCPNTFTRNQNPLLGPLGPYGAANGIPAFALLPGSPAIDATGPCPVGITTDARGVSRTDGKCDSGAFESQGFMFSARGGSPQSTPVNTAFPAALTLTVSSSHGEPVVGGTVTLTGPASSAGITGSPLTATITGTAGAPTGFVSQSATANGTAGGPYNVIASSAGVPVAGNLPYALTNNAIACVVTSTLDPTDPGKVTLRDAVNTANAGSCTMDTITFDPATFATAKTITLANGVLSLSHAMTIVGPGASLLTVSGANASQVFLVTMNTTSVTVSGLTVTGGNTTSNGGGISVIAGGNLTLTDSVVTGNHTTLNGGGIFSDGSLTMQRVTVSSNQGDGSTGGIGAGGIGTVRIEATTVVGNHSGVGGGIGFFNGLPDGIIVNTTVTNNTAPNNGGVIYAGKSLAISNTTIVGNHATGTNGGVGFFATGATMTNTIVANNDPSGQDVTGSFGGTNNLTGTNPLVAPLGSYGGPTQTMPLLPGSPAIDAGAAVGSGPAGATVPATDQRGIARVGTPDIGAFESQGFTLTPVAGSTPQSALVGTTFANPLAVTVASGQGEPVQGGMVGFTATPAGNGAVATLSGPSATIGAGGQASVMATANGIAGAFTVTASTPGATSATFSLTNTAPTITLSPPTLPNGAAEQPYSQTLTASGTGSTLPYTFAITTGTLPAGLILNPTTGVLSGTPTQAGSFPFTVTATDSNRFTGTQSYMLTITAPTIVVAPTSLPGGVKGVAYPATTITASGGMSPYTFAVTTGALPGGLTLYPTTGILSGTPTTTGAFTFTVQAQDTNSFAGMQAYSISVTAAPLVSIAVAPNPATLKVGQVQQFTATGTYADSSTADLTSQVTWSSDASNIVSIDTTGKGTAKVAGTAHLMATQGGVSGQATVTVTPPVLTGVQPAPAPASRPSGASVSGPASPAPAPAPASSGSPTTGGSAPIAAPSGR